ncbi:MAG: S1 RNA-binding domain-containing protein [Acidobacteria bacterium]|nr:S1 RNA-binding domain-containing protein [Acidobacteriota bacterium]
MDSAIIGRIAQDTAIPESSVAAAVSLFEKGCTGPFIVHYRKEITGSLDENKVRAIQERMIYYRELRDQQEALLKLIAEQGKLTDQLREKVESCFTRAELDDLHHQFRPRKKSRAAEAIEKGLEPLAEYFWNQEVDAWSVEEHVSVFVDPEKGVTTREQALQGVVDIIAEWIWGNLDHRRTLREMLWNEGSVVSSVVPAKVGQKTKYNMYYERRESVKTIPSHRVLAIRRGCKEGILISSIEGDNSRAIEFLLNSVIKDRESVFAPVLEAAVRESYNRILRPMVETKVRAQLKEKADREAIRVFQENLSNLLLSPPAGRIVVMGVDWGKGDECSVAVVDESGKFLEAAKVKFTPKQEAAPPVEPQPADETEPSPAEQEPTAGEPTEASGENMTEDAPEPQRTEDARTELRRLITTHKVQAIAIGTGTGARELETALREIVAEENLGEVLIAAVNDAGIAIYSSSRIAREEFPEWTASARCAVSLARRLQDPLSELVKIDPKLIGVGQYQHDVDQKELHRGLVQTVQYCVNKVGVNLNTAGESLLRYVSGLNEKLARRIVSCRTAQGPFRSRESLRSAVGMDDQTYQQCAGFLRISDGENALDRTAVHPETYPIVEGMASAIGSGIPELIGNRELVSSLKMEEFVTDTVGIPTLEDIREELIRPGRDPRKTFKLPKFRADVKELADLKTGMTLEGTVTNVTNFGAFVDIGVRQDGLVHLSQMSNRFIRDPREAVKVGDVVQVKVISVEPETKRIGLSMKALLPAVQRRRKKPQRRTAKAAATSAEETTSAVNAAETASAPAVGPRPKPNRQVEGEHRQRKKSVRKQERKPERPDEGEPEREADPGAPEPSLQEKIAILQSKFRRIN